MTSHEKPLTFSGVFLFWLPLAMTWLMMSIEGPFLAAVIARLPDPKFNLAAYGVAFSLALIVEAPIIMIMSAATALVRNRDSFLKMRTFTYALNGAITVFMLLLIIPPVFYYFAEHLIELPRNVADLTYIATVLLLPWPAAIGFRRFYQGILIRNNQTRRVAYSTIIRLGGMAATALVLSQLFSVDGVVVGAAALSTGVVLEAIANRAMVASHIKRLLGEPRPDIFEPLTYRGIVQFYYPLALTSMISLGVHPLITFFIGRSRFAVESLAILPVVNSLVFIFRSFGMAWQEVAIALMGDHFENYGVLRSFAWMISLASIVGLSIVVFTPVNVLWFREVSGLSPELTSFATLPAQIMVLLPGTTVLLSFQRAVLVNAKKTGPITLATVIEVGTILIVLLIAILWFDLIGAVAAAIALLIGRAATNFYLTIPYSGIVKR